MGGVSDEFGRVEHHLPVVPAISLEEIEAEGLELSPYPLPTNFRYCPFQIKETVPYFDIWAKSLDYGSLNNVL